MMKTNKSKRITASGIVLVCLFMCCVFSACSNKNNDVFDDVAGVDVSTTVAQIQQDYKTAYTLTDNLWDFQIEINNNVYDFPMTVEEFMNCGWKLGKYEETTQILRAGTSGLIWFEAADGSQVNAHILNYSTSEQNYSDCHVNGIIIARDEVDFDIKNIKIAQGITCGVSTFEDIVSAFGEYVSDYDGDAYKIIKYEKDNYKNVSFYVYKDTGVLGKIEMQTNDMPADENGIKDEIYDELPDVVKNYKAPVSAGKTPVDGIIELDGVLYQFPIPVNELIKNGWEIDKENSDENLAGKRSGSIVLNKGDKTLGTVFIRNYSEMKVPVENCVIEDLSASEYENNFVVKNFVDIDITLDEIKELVASYGADVNESDVDYNAKFENENNSIFLYIAFDKSENKVVYYTVGVK